MKYLNPLVEALGIKLQEQLAFQAKPPVLARRMKKDGVMHFVDVNGKILHPVNDCDLSGFHYFPSAIPELDDYSCAGKLCGWLAKGYMIAYGRRDCGWDEIDGLVMALSKFKYAGEIGATIQPTNVQVDMPLIIQQLFPWMEKQAQPAQPCTFLWKIDYQIKIKLNHGRLSNEY